MGDVKLPQFVAFKCGNGKYVTYANFGEEDSPHADRYSRHTLEANEEDIYGPLTRHEVVPTTDGNIMLKCADVPGKFGDFFWCLGPNNRLASLKYNPFMDDNYIFKPVADAIDSKKMIGLKAMGNNKFCNWFSYRPDGYALFLAESDASKTNARLIVAEPVLKRRLCNLDYNLDNAKMYDWQTIALGTRKATNNSSYYDDVTVSITHTQTKSRSWNASVTVGAGVQLELKGGIPLVAEASVTVSASISTTVAMGETVEESTTTTDTFTVKNLSPGGTVVVRLKATQAKCSVPFTYTREDTFSNGEVVKSHLSDGVFVGVNYSSVDWDTSDVMMATT